MNPIDPTAKKQFEVREFTIIHCLAVAGQALLEIKQLELYADAYESFEDYCEDVLGLDKSAAESILADGRLWGVVKDFTAHGEDPADPNTEASV